MEIQVKKTHYSFSEYVRPERWDSYWHQIDEVLRSGAESLLIIGTGDNIVKNVLSEYIPDIRIADIDPQLKPNYLCSVSELNATCTDKFNVVLCCQVLEHLPFDLFEQSIQQLAEVCTNYCILSLPQKQFQNRISFVILNRKFDYQYVFVCNNIRYEFNGEHYWEIGTKNASLTKIENLIKKYFQIENVYTVKNNPYHRFFRLKKIKF